jgi:hypothetical protein
VDGNILNSKGVHVGVVVGDEVFGLKGSKLYDLKGSNIYKGIAPCSVELYEASLP